MRLILITLVSEQLKDLRSLAILHIRAFKRLAHANFEH